MTPQTWAIQWWYEALAAPYGIYIRTTDEASCKRLSVLLYKSRQDLKDPRLASFTIRTAPNDVGKTIWIVKTRKEEAAA